MQTNQEKEFKSQTTVKTIFDLEDRTLVFSLEVVRLCKKLQRNPMNDRIVGQVVGSSGSIGANYREANDALGKKDFVLRLKISRKEAKETMYWLRILEEANPQYQDESKKLLQEATELKNILSSIIDKVENNNKKETATDRER